jgi:signal transduction histidine kinase
MDKPLILVVEDEKDVAKVIAINLKLEGMDVIEAHDGPAALRVLEEQKPDCVVLDIMLPRISGWDILKFIKSRPTTVDTPVVMVTAKVGERDQLRGLGAGAVKYLTKPFSPVSLTEAIKSVLKPQARDMVARERKDTIERLQLSTLYKISDILISTPELDDLLARVAEKLMALFDLPCCGFFLSEDDPDLYVFRDRGGHNGKVNSTGARVLKEMDEGLRSAFATNRMPARLSEVKDLDLEPMFTHCGEATEGYVLPMFEADVFLGAIVTAGRPEVHYSQDEEDLLTTIANQVASALARARMHEVLREDDRTHKNLLHQTITAQEAERRRIAADIHDSVVQALVGVSFKLQALDKSLPAGSNGLHEEILHLQDLLNINIEELRRLLLGLRPPMLDDLGLFTALETHLNSFGKETGFSVSLVLPEERPRFTRNAQINLFRIIQEALNNVQKHSSASRVSVGLEAADGRLQLTVSDDGRGFAARKLRSKHRNMGFASMRERAELLGGELSVDSKPGEGTLVSLNVPLKPILEG